MKLNDERGHLRHQENGVALRLVGRTQSRIVGIDGR